MTGHGDDRNQGQGPDPGPGDLREYEFSFNFSLPSGEIEPDVCLLFRNSHYWKAVLIHLY